MQFKIDLISSHTFFIQQNIRGTTTQCRGDIAEEQVKLEQQVKLLQGATSTKSRARPLLSRNKSFLRQSQPLLYKHGYYILHVRVQNERFFIACLYQSDSLMGSKFSVKKKQRKQINL